MQLLATLMVENQKRLVQSAITHLYSKQLMVLVLLMVQKKTQYFGTNLLVALMQMVLRLMQVTGLLLVAKNGLLVSQLLKVQHVQLSEH